MSRKKPENLSFEEALSELEALVEQLENGEISLDESLKSFERGVALTRSCQTQLQNAELKVKTLSEETLQIDSAPNTADPEDGIPF